MGVIRVLVTVPDTRAVVESAVSMAFAPATAPDLPPGFVMDPSFPAVPVASGAVNETVAVMSAGMAMLPQASDQIGPGAFVVRGVIDENEFDRAVSASRLPDGTVRVFADPQISAFPTCGQDPALGTGLDVKRLLGAGRLMQRQMNGTDVALAIVDTGISLPFLQTKGVLPRLDAQASWSSSSALLPGQATVGHGTMCAYDALLMAPQALLFDCAVLTAPPAAGSIMSGTLSNAVAAYGKLLQLMLLSPDERHFHSMVVSNSWGMYQQAWDFPSGHPGRYGDNPNHPFNIQVASLASAGADILFAAGNCGPVCPDGRCDKPTLPPIFMANSHPDVLCVAGVDTSGSVVGYSSRGPGILGNQKPDIAAYTHFVGSEVYGKGAPDSGTSAACPVMAGVIAALRSAFPYDSTLVRRAPANVRSFLKSTAVGTGVWQNDWGSGIIDTSGFVNAGATL